MSEAGVKTGQWGAALALFDRWLEMSPAAQQAELQRLRASDPVNHQRLLTLIQADASADADHFLGGTAIDDAMPDPATAVEPPPLPADVRIGPWTLERSLGAGGMGRVWLARRRDGLYDGQVAIKMLRDTVADEFANERFAREGQILARLAHPNIARLLDAGILSDGQRYLVIEYVLGERIDRHCDDRKLDVAARIRLFLQVCAAVAHAHANLVVHRDLKPANVLVQSDDQVKLLDFGVAKLIEAETEEASPLTLVAGAGLTPEYAAPEQIEGGTITTATDVYALGMVLYRLLSGSRPYGGEAATPARLARDIVDTEPRRLSASIAPAAGPQMRSIAACRATTPERLQRQLRGDLDNILAKTLRKKPDERYASVQALIDDLENYLANRPVSARQDSVGYRLGKFVRRHRTGVAATVALILAVMGGIAGVVWQARIAVEQRSEAERQAGIAREQSMLASSESEHARAETARATAEEAKAKERQAEAERYRAQATVEAKRARENETKARHEAEQATAVKNFMVDIFRTNLPASASIEQTQQLTARQLLDTGSQRIGIKFASQPEIRADLLDIVGELYYRLGDYERAKQLTKERIALLESMSQDTRGDRLVSHHNLALLAAAAGNTVDQRQAVAAWAPLVGVSGDRHDVAGLLRLADADLYGNPRQSIELAKQALTALAKFDHLTTSAGAVENALQALAEARRLLGQDDQAVAAAEEALQTRRRISPADSYPVALAEATVGHMLYSVEKRKEAESRLTEALYHAEKILGKAHPEVLKVRVVLGSLLHQSPRRNEGLEMLAEAVQQSARSARHNAIAETKARQVLANAYYREGRFADAEPLVANIIAATRDNDDLRLLHADALILDARLRAGRGKVDDALASAKQATQIKIQALGEKAPPVAEGLIAQGEVLLSADRVGDGRSLLTRAEQIPEASGRRLPVIQWARDTLSAEMRLWWGEADASRLAFNALLKRLEADPERDYHRDIEARILLGIGRSSLLRGHLDVSRQAFERAVSLRRQLGPADNPWLAEAKVALADCLISQGDRKRAATLLSEAEAAFQHHLPLSRRFLYPLEKVKQRL